MKNLLLTATALAVLTAPARAAAGEITQVTLRIDGLLSDEDGAAVMEALGRVPNVKVATRPIAQNPTVVVVPLDGAGYDLGDLARTVAGAKTPNRAKEAPSAWLLLACKERDGGAARDLETICARLEGVEAKKCRLDAARGELRIKLDDKGGAKLADIRAAFPGLDTEYYPKR